MMHKPQLIVALDVDNIEKAEQLVSILSPAVNIFKVGSQLFTIAGPEVVRMIKGKGAQVFLDLKFHDIPNTVREATSAATASTITIITTATQSVDKDATKLAVFMMTVHIQGGREMLEAAMEGATEKARELNIRRPFIVGVTCLTSNKNDGATKENVLMAAMRAKDAGLDGVVCSAHEALVVRKELGKDFFIVTPGIRPKGYPKDDQSRVATAQEAKKSGADFIVVGRPIIKAENPLQVAQDIIEEIRSSE